MLINFLRQTLSEPAIYVRKVRKNIFSYVGQDVTQLNTDMDNCNGQTSVRTT